MSEKSETIENIAKIEDLKALKTKALVGMDCFLNDDILKNNLLLLKKGVYLDNRTIDKLINFGIKEAMVKLETRNNTIKDDNKINNVKTQKIVIMQKTFAQISKIVKEFIGAGVSENSLYATTDLNLLQRYIQAKNVSHIFADSALYTAQFEMIINQKTDLKVFLMNCNSNATIRCFSSANVNRIYKPLNSTIIRFLLGNNPKNKKVKPIRIINGLK